MKNTKKILGMTMILTLVVCAAIKGIAASAGTSGIIKPQLKLMGLRASYKFDSRLNFNIATSNYTRKVKYRVSLYDLGTKKTLNLTKGFSKSMGGSKAFAFSVLPKGSGKYKLQIYIKALASKAGYDNYVEKSFVIEANKASIASELKYAEALASSKAVGSKLGNVTSGNMELIKAAIKAAKEVKANVNSSQITVNARLKALTVATGVFSNSVIKTADKTALIKTIKAAQLRVKTSATGTLPLQTGQVLIRDKMILIKAIAAATNVAIDDYATVSSINTAIDRLNLEVAVFGYKLKGGSV